VACDLQDRPPTVGDLVGLTEAQLMEERNFGAKSLGEMKALLAALGLRLRGD
jgi:DNA-directed RNA polymerase alpha subunit